MKKIIFLFIALLGVCFVYGQDITDAVRYSNDEVKGTARFRAMGGAFGALGGDLSAVNINPASSAVFIQSRASFTTGFNFISNNSEYFGSSLSDTDSNINFYQGGGVFVYASNNPKTKWKKFSLGVAYDEIENYSDSWGVSSLDASTSISEYFAWHGTVSFDPSGVVAFSRRLLVMEFSTPLFILTFERSFRAC